MTILGRLATFDMYDDSLAAFDDKPDDAEMEVFDPPAAPRRPAPSMSAERQHPQRDAQF